MEISPSGVITPSCKPEFDGCVSFLEFITCSYMCVNLHEDKMYKYDNLL